MSREDTEIHTESGVEIPYEQIDPETLDRLIQEFVSRDGADWGDAGGTMEDKVGEVLQQLKSRKIKIVFDLTSQSANFVVCR